MQKNGISAVSFSNINSPSENSICQLQLYIELIFIFNIICDIIYFWK